MSVEAWEEVQRHGQDLADRLAQGFSGLLHPPPFPCPPATPQKPPFDLDTADGVSAILDIGSRLGRAGAEFGACLNGVVHQFFRRIPVPFRQDEAGPGLKADLKGRKDGPAESRFACSGERLGLAAVERFGDSGVLKTATNGEPDEFVDEDGFGFGQFGRPQDLLEHGRLAVGTIVSVGGDM